MLFHAVFILVATVSIFVHGYTNPLACSGNCGETHDPSMIRRTSDGTYFRFATGGLIPILTSPSLTGPWTAAGSVLSTAAAVDNSGNTDLWAPDVHLVGSTYYCFYAASTFGTQNSVIGLATSTTLESGSWTDHGAIISSDSSVIYNAIDPNLQYVGGGSYYLNFGSFYGDIFQVPMSNPPTKTTGTPYMIAFNGSGSHSEEGAYMQYVNGYYYLFWSAGQCCNLATSPPAAGGEYHVQVCRSTSATGGFVDKNGISCVNGGGTTILASHDSIYAPGGQGLFNDPTYGWIMYYHYLKPSDLNDGDTLLGVNKVDFSSGWPVI